MVFVAGLPGLVPVHQQRSVVTFSSVRACFGLPLPCLLLVLPVSRILLSPPYSSFSPEIPSVVSVNGLILRWGGILNRVIARVC